jgi:stage II sporulation SpoD-like protein
MTRIALRVASVLAAIVGAVTAPVASVAAEEVRQPAWIVVCEVPGRCAADNLYVLRFEVDYVPNVLPNEWMCSWSAASVRAGAIAARTYAWWRHEHPRSDTFHIYGTSADQNYRRASAHPTCDARVRATAGTRLESDGRRAFAAYRAETGNPTESGGRPYLVPVRDPHTTQGPTGPGLCQHGSEYLADNGIGTGAILRHYYTGITVASGAHWFLGVAYACTSHGRIRIETWVDPVTDTHYERVFDMGACPI